MNRVQFLYKGKDIIVYNVLGIIKLQFHFKYEKYQRMEWKYHRPEKSNAIFDLWMHFILSIFQNFSKFESSIQTKQDIPPVMQAIITHVARVLAFRDKVLLPLSSGPGTMVMPLLPLPEALKKTKAADLSEKHKGLGDIVFQLIIKNKKRACQMIIGLSHPYPCQNANIVCEKFIFVSKENQDAIKKATENSQQRLSFVFDLAKTVKKILQE